jgi:hypothetical protein
MKTRLYLTVALLSCVAIGAACGASVNTNQQAASPSPEAVGTPAAASGELQIAAPETVVADLYKQHDAKKSPFFQTKNRSLVDKYFTKAIADLIWKDATTSKGEVGAIDFDPLYNAQDVDIKNFAVGRGDVKDENATVAVTFTNYDAKQTLIFALKLIDNNWKIDDIKYPEGHSLSKILKETYAAGTKSGASGEFEGKYTVGDTACTVKPVKTAFEVRWAKGSGSEYFFYKDATVFESEEDKTGGRNEFRFTDEKYNTGTFVRADGKTFAVSRAK